MKILHLSDMHIDENFNWSPINKKPNAANLSEEIHNAIQNEGIIDVLILSGDFTNTGSFYEFECCEEVLRSIKDKICPDHIKNVVLAPGNHDFPWNEKTQSAKAAHYLAFKRNVKKLFECNDEALPFQNEIDQWVMDYTYIDNFETNILIIGLNSIRIDNEEHQGIGFFNKSQLDRMVNIKKYFEKKSMSKKMATFVVFHHHIVPTEQVDHDYFNDKKISVTIDARQAIDYFIENNITFAFHGHKHHPSILKIEDGMKNTGNYLSIISSEGISVEAINRGSSHKNGFMIYSIDNNILTVKHYCASRDDDYKFCFDKNCKYRAFVFNNPSCDMISSQEHLNIKYNCIDTSETSQLHMLFINARSCVKAREAIRQFVKEYNKRNKRAPRKQVHICSLYDLYGKFDILFKYRVKDQNDFKTELIKALKDNDLLSTGLGFNERSRHIAKEYTEFLGKPLRTPIIHSSIYKDSTWNIATLEVLIQMNPDLSSVDFMEILEKEIVKYNKMYNVKLESIITNINVTQVDSIIFELLIPCHKFPLIAKFSHIVEEIIAPRGVDKNTHIIYKDDM